jgi:hypothetical protein
VVAFIDSLNAMGAPIVVGSIGRTVEGREIPYVLVSRPLVHTPEEAKRTGKPIVYVQANIHAGEVEGKEALLALLRDLVLDRRENVLDSLVLIAVPIYNADGNERFGPQARNRSEQNGPERVGVRTNAQSLDLNRDYIKAEAPETQASLRMFEAWKPDVFMDLHTTDGSYHGYALTYSPSLNPAAGAAGAYTRDRLLPELRQRVRERDGFETFDYGNFSLEYGSDVDADTTRRGWFTYDARPRFGTNYFGLRHGISILSEAFSHDPFERRVLSTRAFVREALSLIAERSAAVLAITRADLPAPGAVPIRSELTRTPYVGDVIAEDLARADREGPSEPGVPPGLRRTGHYRSLRIPVYDRFTPTLLARPPVAYALRPGDRDAVALLRLHGLVCDSLAAPRSVSARVFVVDSVVAAARPFQGHTELRLEGRWKAERRSLPAGSFLVSTSQPLGTLATYLLDPRSDDGLVTWSRPAGAGEPWKREFFGGMKPGQEYPVIEVTY